MDEFAQSRGDDDLFADEFEPVAEPVSAATVLAAEHANEPRGNRPGQTVTRGGRTPTAIVSPANNHPENKQTTGPPAEPRHGRVGAAGGREERRGGRGGGGNKGGSGDGLGSSRYAAPAADEDKPDIIKPDIISTSAAAQPTPRDTQSTTILSTPAPLTMIVTPDVDSDVTPPSDQQQPPTQPPPFSRPTAVRGDRHLTGGPAHKKLTEAELTEKMEKMKILNARKAERFRLSEEDSAAYARKEKEMAKKRVEEQKNARAMDMERAKNRQRKLAAQGGREWDEGKQESDIVDGRNRGRSSEYVRGGHGGVIRGELARSRYAQEGEDGEGGKSFGGRGGFEIRGRGNRGGRGGRGGSRGGKPSPATVPTADDFPELPTTAKPPTTETMKSPIDKSAGDWAEEMATPVEEKQVEI